MPENAVLRVDVVSIGPVEVKGAALAIGQVCEVDGMLRADIVYRCVRCLEDVSDRLEVSLHEVFSRIPVTKEQEEADVLYLPEDEIDLDPHVQQDMILALEAQPLCRPDCAGLCPVCGNNRNTDPCTCQERQVDPRLEALSSYFDDMKDGSN